MNLKVSEAKREDGFTLIELLVVVIIIGILAAIAIPVFLNQRERAWIGSVESDVRNAAIEVETLGTRAGTYPTTAAEIPITDERVSAGVTLYYLETAAATDNFQLCGEHTQLDGDEVSIVYDSNTGGLAAAWTGDTCTTVNASYAVVATNP